MPHRNTSVMDVVRSLNQVPGSPHPGPRSVNTLHWHWRGSPRGKLPALGLAVPHFADRFGLTCDHALIKSRVEHRFMFRSRSASSLLLVHGRFCELHEHVSLVPLDLLVLFCSFAIHAGSSAVICGFLNWRIRIADMFSASAFRHTCTASGCVAVTTGLIYSRAVSTGPL
jgi:hypothetical protein